MACRDGFLKLACKVILLYGGRRQIGWILGRFFWFTFFTFWLCARKSDVSLRFPFVQPHSWICRFRFCKSQLLKNFWWKDWTGLRSDPWTEKMRNFGKFEKIAEIWFWKLISLAFSNCGIEMIAVAIFKMLRTRKIAKKLDFWSLVNPKICLGPALRALFRILAKPRV